MAKYSSFKYSDQKYGHTGAYPDTTTWIVKVDWNNDGTLEGYNEGNHLIGCNMSLGRQELLNADGSGFEHMRVSKATLVFDNDTGRYDARNAAGPLYPNVKPGRKIQVGIFDEDHQEVQFTGLIDSIAPHGYNDEVTITCVDYMQWLADQELTYDAELFNTTITEAMNHLLTQAEYPGGRLLDDEDQPVWVVAVNKESAGTVVHQMADAGLGIFWVDQYGRACYQKRDHTNSSSYLTQTSVSSDIMRSQPWDGIYNEIDVIRQRYIKLQPAIIFTLPEAIFIANGDAVDVEVSYNTSTDVAVGAITGNTRADGEGSALTIGASAIDIGLTGGTITVANASGSDGYLMDIVIRGRKYVSTEQKSTASDATSRAAYGVRRFRLNSPYLQDRNYASNFATILLDFLKDDRESLTLKIRGRPTTQYYMPLMDQVEFTSTTLGIAGEAYQILGVDHDWMNDNGQDVLTTIYLHKTLSDSTAITPGNLETAPVVPDAPPGYDDPGGDPEGIDPNTGWPPTGLNPDRITPTGEPMVAIYHNGVFVGYASDLDFLDG